jgi:hypothetical protein
LGGRVRQISEFEASLGYRVSSSTARTTQRNPVSKKKKKNIYIYIYTHTHTHTQTNKTFFLMMFSGDRYRNKKGKKIEGVLAFGSSMV